MERFYRYRVKSAAASVPAGSCRPAQQRGEPLQAPEDCHVINLDTAFGQQFVDVPIGKSVAAGTSALAERTATMIT